MEEINGTHSENFHLGRLVNIPYVNVNENVNNLLAISSQPPQLSHTHSLTALPTALARVRIPCCPVRGSADCQQTNPDDEILRNDANLSSGVQFRCFHVHVCVCVHGTAAQFQLQ